MYIQPETNVKILKNVPLDNTYDHTLWFNNATKQASYFADNLAKFHLTNYTYQRVNKGAIRVEINANKLYDCNYLMFQNTAFGNKWFFAFIKSVEYVNNVCSEITYEIDVMQTWLFDYHMDRCFVEREHVSDDRIGVNLVNENFNVTNYVATNVTTVNLKDKGMVAIGLATDTPTGNYDPSLYGTLYANVYVGMLAFNYPLYTQTGLNGLSELIGPNGYASKPNALLKIQEVPNWLVDNTNENNNYHASTTESVIMKKTLNGYTPKNNKLYNYPYNKLVMTNNEGMQTEFGFEYFPSSSDTHEPIVNFGIEGVRIPNPEITCYPILYQNIPRNYELSVSFSNFPQVAWSSDYFREWLNNNHYRISTAMGNMVINSVANSITGLVTAGTNYASTGNPISSASSLINTGVSLSTNLLTSVNSVMGEVATAKSLPNQNYGGISNTNINAIAQYKYSIRFIQECASYDVLKSIDDYFSMFGYRIAKVKVPNRNSRPHWNYVKTSGCVITGSVPADDMKKIISVYDNGVTFWKHGSEVGRYDLDNSPTT